MLLHPARGARAFQLIGLVVAAFCTLVSPAGADVATLILPAPESSLRSEILNAARPTFIAETGGSIEFVVHRLAVLGDWAFGDVTLQRPGGAAIDWSKTKYADQYAYPETTSDITLFLLHRTNTGWEMKAFVIGPTDVAWEAWEKQFQLPHNLFSE